MDDIAVLIPCYNEELTIKKVIIDVRRVLPQAKIYVYDNNSTDNTATIAKDMNVIVRNEPKQGKGAVIASMFYDIEASCYIIIDGDDACCLNSLTQMSDMVLYQGMDMVIGDRLSSTYYLENKRRFHNLGNKLILSMTNYLFRSKLPDILSGYRAFSKRFVKSLGVLSSGFEIETEISIHALMHGMHIASIPISYRDRPEGSYSKLHTYSDGAKIFKTIVDLFCNYKPFTLFSTLSVILLLGSLGSMIILSRSTFGIQSGNGLVLLTTTILLATGSIISFCTGVICHNLKNFYLRIHDILKKSIKTPSVSTLNHISRADTTSRINRDIFQDPDFMVNTGSFDSNHELVDLLLEHYHNSSAPRHKDKIIN